MVWKWGRYGKGRKSKQIIKAWPEDRRTKGNLFGGHRVYSKKTMGRY